MEEKLKKYKTWIIVLSVVLLGIGSYWVYINKKNCQNPVIKGNINSEKVKIYHVPGGKYYPETIIDESKGEKWFCSEEEAKKAGWRKSDK